METENDTTEKPYILSFVGENANGILRWWTTHILQACAKLGFDYCLLDLCGGDWRDQLTSHLARRKPVFCFSFQGFGMNLQTEDGNLWSVNQIPFLSYVGDNPHHAPWLHAADGPGLQLLYSCGDFLQTYRAMGGPLYARTFRYGYPENDHADAIAWSRRQHPIVFVKTGVDPAALRAEWNELPRPTAHLIDACGREILQGGDRTVFDVCADAFEADGQHVGVHNEQFLLVCSKVDFYVRAVRAERMVRGLQRHDALILGDWSHLDRRDSRARFAAAMPAAELDRLYADSRIVVSTTATVRQGMHERVMAGLLAKAVVVSDETPFLQRLLRPCPSFKGLPIDDEAFADRLDAAVSDSLADPDMPDKLEVSARFAREEFSLDHFALALVDQVRLELHRRSIEMWRFRPKSRSRELT